MSKECLNCGRGQDDRPAVFRNEDWCCELCRKQLERKAADG